MREKTIRALRWSLAAVLVIAGAGAPDARATTLRWKFKAGETLHYVMDQKTVTQVKGAQQDLKTTITQTVDMSWAIKNVASDGTADVALSIDRVRTSMDLPFGPFKYDSKDADAKPPEGPVGASVGPLLKALVGAQFTFKMNPQGELNDIKVPESLAKSIREAGPAGGGPGGNLYSEDGWKNMIRESSLALPADDLTKGKTWTRQTKVPSPPVGTLTMDKTYTFQGTDPDAGENVQAIELGTRIDLKTDAPDAGLAIKIKEQDGKGRFLFDTAAGRVVRSSVTEKVDTVITLGKMEITQSSDTTTTMKLVPGDSDAK